MIKYKTRIINIEYKLKLCNMTNHRIQELIPKMNLRLKEG